MEPKEATYQQNDKIVIRCSATLKILHQKRSPHLHGRKLVYDLNEAQEKASHRHNRRANSIFWYKENEIIKMTSPMTLVKTKLRQDQSVMSPPQIKAHNNKHKLHILTEHDLSANLLKSVLTIENAKASDSGKYKCVYENIQEQVTVNVKRNTREHYTLFFLN